MESYKKPYFILSAALCDVIDSLEQFVADASLDSHTVESIYAEIQHLKTVHQAAEEQVISGE
ncbi:hypothetical protein [Ruminococcus sp.]|uniref:hypothetical protein n=1 Tax=Ruminococcus sp. TaxID=41978 RepID=UPI0025E77673|nr:hypothetical protein [Ruminococcus sp.]